MRKYLLILLLYPFIVGSVKGQVQYGLTDTTYVSYGLSTDSKPTPPANYCYFVEVNTNKTYVSNGGVWALVGIGVDSIASRLAFVTDSLATAVAASIAATYATIANLALKAPINNATFTGTFAAPNSTITNAMLANGAVANLSGTNTGDNATNSQYSGLVSNATHTGDATGATALTVVRINGTSMAGLATGILKNTTGTGVPSIAVAGDFPTLNQATTNSAASLSITGQTGLMTVVGLTSTSRVKTVRDAADTFLELGGSYTPTGTWTSLTMVTPVLGTPTSGNLANCTFPTLNQSTTGSAARWTTGRTLTISGDIAYTSPSFDGTGNVTAAGTLATVNANVGTFTNTTVTVNAKGLVTAISSGSSSGQTFSQVSALMVIRY